MYKLEKDNVVRLVPDIKGRDRLLSLGYTELKPAPAGRKGGKNGAEKV